MPNDHNHADNKVNSEKQRKWNNIYRNAAPTAQHLQPAKVLSDFAHLLPTSGRALDLACGTGGNALFLAAQGLECWAWDISNVVLEQLDAEAEKVHLTIQTEICDIENEFLPNNKYNVIVVSQFLNRSICDQIIKMLESGGLLYYQTFTIDAKVVGIGPKNPDYLLCPNELLSLFDGLHVLGYREDGLISNSHNGLQGQAYLVARKNTGERKIIKDD